MKSLAIALLLTVSVCVGQESLKTGKIVETARDTFIIGTSWISPEKLIFAILAPVDTVEKLTITRWNYDSSYIQIFSKISGKKVLGIDSSLRNYYFTKEFDGKIVINGKQIYPPLRNRETLRRASHKSAQKTDSLIAFLDTLFNVKYYSDTINYFPGKLVGRIFVDDKKIQPQTFEDLYNARLEDFATIFVVLWDEYAKECWADSTQEETMQYRKMFQSEVENSIKHGTSYWKDSYGGWTMVNPMKDKKRWVHPTKSTLEGFVEFLRRKTK